MPSSGESAGGAGGPYLSDRQWGTVREDYSADGEAWTHFTHELARSRAYRWGEDAIAGFSDANQRWCLGLSLWNGRDRILKERLFGLTNGEGNHGEDVKEHYWHLDGLPSHAYMAMLYRYPHAALPLRSADRGERPARLRRPRIRARGHRPPRRKPLLRRHGGIRQGDPRRCADARHGREPRVDAGEGLANPAGLGTQHLELGSPVGGAPTSEPIPTTGAGSSRRGRR